MTKHICDLCHKPYANLKNLENHQKNIHPNGEIKIEKPSLKTLTAEINGLETQVTTAESNLTSLRNEMRARLEFADQEKDIVIGNLNDMTRRFNNLQRKYIDLKAKSKKESIKKRAHIVIINGKLRLEKDKNIVLQTKLGKFGNQSL